MTVVAAARAFGTVWLRLRCPVVQMGGDNTKTDPPVLRFNLCSQAFKQDPFPTMARIRQLGPVIRARLPLSGTVRLATTYDAAKDLLRNHRRFVQSAATGKTMRYLRDEIGRQSEQPRDGLLAALIQAEEVGDRRRMLRERSPSY